MQKKWLFKTSNNENSQKLIDLTGSRVLATLLANRGIENVEEAKVFLSPIKTTISSPYSFVDMEKAVNRIFDTIEKEENITVYGDFDTDGITSTALLYKTLKEIGAKVDFYLPDRASESHGLNTKALIQLISKHKSKLIITVDCGIGNANEIAFAKTFKTDIIVTDHHEAPETLPSAFAIIDPKAKNILSDNLSFEEIESLNYLAGVGVAFKLACALLEKSNKQNFVEELLPLVAIGTIGDIVPLLKENRSLVTSGMELIKQNKHFGLSKLISNLKIDTENLNSETIAFSIVPRLNATGRLETPLTALNLLISEEEKVVEESIEKLNVLNTQRQELCDQTFLEAVEMINQNPAEYQKVIVLHNQNWHIGIIGIVASKLVEKYHRPVFLMTSDTNDTNKIRCSSRSIKGISIFEIISSLSDKLLNFGGHTMAGGFSFDRNVVSFENIKALINRIVKENTADFDFSPMLEIDMVLEEADLTLGLIDDIKKLEPFGAENPVPVFAVSNLKLKDYKQIGTNSNHLKFYLQSTNGEVFECVKWNTKNFSLPLNSQTDIAFYPKKNEFNGKTTLQLDVIDIHNPFLKQEATNELQILDHRKKTDILNKVIDYILTTKKSTAIVATQKRTLEVLTSNIKIKDKIYDSEIETNNFEQIMLFDCPETKEELRNLLSDSKAKTLHLMNFDAEEITTNSILSKVSGMLKYCTNNLNGELKLISLTQNLNVSINTVKLILDLLEQAGMISIEEIDEQSYKITFNKTLTISELEKTALYSELAEEIENINNFRQCMKNSSIEELHQILNL